MPRLCKCGCGQVTRVSLINDAYNGYVKGEHRNYVKGHQPLKRKYTPIEDRFTMEPNSGCWLWLGDLRRGYGYLCLPLSTNKIAAHRFMYELIYGPIPEGLYLDHRCKTRCCVNPSHLEPVTFGENVRRGWIDRRVNAPRDTNGE